MYEALGAEWHWYRFEYQARGSTHTHGCTKLKNDPWLLEQELKQIGSAPSPEQAQALQCGEEATALVLQYADYLVTTCNPRLPDDFWSLPEPHPCTLLFPQLDDIDSDYCDLVNSGTTLHTMQCCLLSM